MKLRNKKTGDIGYLQNDWLVKKLRVVNTNNDTVGEYTSLADFNEEWEDYEEPKGTALDLMILTLTNFIENEPDEDKVDLEECKQMLEKLKAWKRLKDKGFQITDWDNSIGDDYYKTGQIVLNLNNVKNTKWDEYEQISEIKNDLDFLFGGEE